MQFYNATDKELSLYHDTLFLVGLEETNTTEYPVDGTFTRNANIWYRRCDQLIWEVVNAKKIWSFDDSNHTTLPVAYTNLVDSQEDYTLPSTARKIHKVEILDSSSNYVELTPIGIKEVKGAWEEFMETDGVPRYYRLVGNSILLKPNPSSSDVTTTNGLRFHFDRDIDAFTPADTTQEPGFDNHFHRVISLGCALDYANSNELKDKIQHIDKQLQELIFELKKFYGKRLDEEAPRITPASGSYI